MLQKTYERANKSRPNGIPYLCVHKIDLYKKNSSLYERYKFKK